MVTSFYYISLNYNIFKAVKPFINIPKWCSYFSQVFFLSLRAKKFPCRDCKSSLTLLTAPAGAAAAPKLEKNYKKLKSIRAQKISSWSGRSTRRQGSKGAAHKRSNKQTKTTTNNDSSNWDIFQKLFAFVLHSFAGGRDNKELPPLPTPNPSWMANKGWPDWWPPAGFGYFCPVRSRLCHAPYASMLLACIWNIPQIELFPLERP